MLEEYNICRGRIAQSVEHGANNARVLGSSPSMTNLFAHFRLYRQIYCIFFTFSNDHYEITSHVVTSLPLSIYFEVLISDRVFDPY